MATPFKIVYMALYEAIFLYFFKFYLKLVFSLNYYKFILILFFSYCKNIYYLL